MSKVKKALDDWDPKGLWEKEIDYRADLACFLREELPESFVVEEYGHGRSRKDIKIESKESDKAVAIELKYNLNSSNEANRLLGQTLRYKDSVDVIFVILINCNPNHVAEIEKSLQHNFEEDTVELITMEIE
ncbi:MAG: hypothetical protein AB2777_16770 [Candidatus Thiodiazotropha endolucinida]